MMYPSHLQLGDCETTSSTYTTVVLDRWGANNRSELVYWTRGDLSSLLETGIATSELSSGLEIVNLRMIKSRSIFIPGRS